MSEIEFLRQEITELRRRVEELERRPVYAPAPAWYPWYPAQPIVTCGGSDAE